MFICQLNCKKSANGDNEDEIEVFYKDAFGPDENGALDVTRPSVRFDLAASVGRDAGLDMCLKLYGRCGMPYNEMLRFMGDMSDVENTAEVVYENKF